MRALVFLDVLGHLFGNHIMVAEQVAEERGKFVGMLVGSSCFHKPVVVLGKALHAIWGIEKCRNLVNCNFLLYQIFLG